MDNFNTSIAASILWPRPFCCSGTFAAEVPAEVEADREVLATLTERVGDARAA
jgi:hypothetical protein